MRPNADVKKELTITNAIKHDSNVSSMLDWQNSPENA